MNKYVKKDNKGKVIAGTVACTLLAGVGLMAIPQVNEPVADTLAEHCSPLYQSVVSENAFLKLTIEELRENKTELQGTITEIDNKLVEETDETKVKELNTQKTLALEEVEKIDNRIAELESYSGNIEGIFDVTSTVNQRYCNAYLSSDEFVVDGLSDEELASGSYMTPEIRENTYMYGDGTMQDLANYEIISNGLKCVNEYRDINDIKLNLKSMMLALQNNLNISISSEDLTVNNINTTVGIPLTAENLVVKVDGVETTDYTARFIKVESTYGVFVTFDNSVEMFGCNINYDDETKIATVDIITNYDQVYALKSGNYEFVEDLGDGQSQTHTFSFNVATLTFERIVDDETFDNGFFELNKDLITLHYADRDEQATIENGNVVMDGITYTFVEDLPDKPVEPGTDFENPDEEL